MPAKRIDAATPRRPRPRIIHVPAPEGLGIPPFVITIGAIVLAASGVVALCLAVALTAWLVLAGVPALIGAGLLAWWAPRRERRYAQRRAEYVARMREPDRAPVVRELAEKWAANLKDVASADVKAAVAKPPATDDPRAQVVCLGTFDVPEVDEEFFEPEIIAPTRYIGWQLVLVPIAAFVIAVWFLQAIDVIHTRRMPLTHYAYALMMGVGVGIDWVRRTVLRPTYIRLAPGVVQILEYRFRKGKPTIRSYPMDGDTLAILRGKVTEKKRWNFSLTLLRGEQQDTIDVSRIRDRETAAQHVWHALLSTAATPPLSDEELVG